MKKTFELNLYHTSDTHGHLTSDPYNGQKPLPKGLARVSTFLKTQNHEHKIIIDNGDTIQGSPLAYIFKEQENQDFHPFAEVLNKIGYDYFVPGNHDFNYGLKQLNHMISKLNAKTLCSNVYQNDDLYFDYAYDIKSYIDGPTIGIIGITNNYIPNWESKDNIKDLIFENAYLNAKKMVNEIKNKVDFIILSYHGGYECNINTGVNEAKNSDENLGCKIFTEIKEIDCLLTGHEHRLLTKIEDLRIMHQPGYAASHISHTKIEFIKEDNWKVKEITGQLISMEDYEDDQEILRLVQPFIHHSEISMKQVIGKSLSDLKIKDPFLDRLHKHPVFQYINEVQMNVTQAMISCCGLGNDVTGFGSDITFGDVINTYVFPNTLYLVEISGKTLKDALRHQAKFFMINQHKEIDINPTYLYPKKELYNYDIFDGVSYDLIIKENGENEVRNVRVKEKEVFDEEMFTLVLNSYRMSGGGNITWHKDLKIIKAFPLDITEILIEDIKQKKTIKVNEQHNIKIIKEVDK